MLDIYYTGPWEAFFASELHYPLIYKMQEIRQFYINKMF